jgi:hypothetical protein
MEQWTLKRDDLSTTGVAQAMVGRQRHEAATQLDDERVAGEDQVEGVRAGEPAGRVEAHGAALGREVREEGLCRRPVVRLQRPDEHLAAVA